MGQSVATATASPTGVATGPATEKPEPFDPLAGLGRAWDDRRIFEAGLITGEQDVLNQLEGATVYHMTVAIAEALTSLSAAQAIWYTNGADVPLNEIYFRLFPNLAGGSIVVNDVRVDGRLVEPAFELEESAMRVPLTRPLAPGEQVQISMTFEVGVPTETGGNYGQFIFENDILTLAHFYPILAVYDDEGWNLEIPPPAGDMVYAESSFYVVEVRAPVSLKMAASGIAVSRHTTASEQTVLYAAGPARDFYLAGSERYQVATATVDEITINSYVLPEYEEASTLALTYAIAALESLGQRFGPYPYTEFDILSTPTLALGIEYPGIVVLTEGLYQVEETTALESTTVHEVAHQWFYAVVGNDQLDEPWLDESLAQYATALYFGDRYGQNSEERVFQSFASRWGRAGQSDIPIGLPVAAYTPLEYGAIVYGRGPIFVRTLAETMGQDSFMGFMQDYYQQFKWDIARTESFKDLAEIHCDCDLTLLFQEWVYGKE